ncbi:amidohydrolase [Jonesia quinghaiensis]|uniref:amidohydrolase n=1 Tax=Jonesia quinghaiensis TaxID=262806 RepID=UPI000421E8AC|nr:amidohydrolase family protein [Jonesia quinghaiensis]
MSSTLVINAVIHSGQHPFAQALLIENGVIAWCGDMDAAASYQRTATQIIDAQGALLTPGFVDAHVHVLETAFALSATSLSPRDGIATREAALSALSAATKTWKPGDLPVTSIGWDDSAWPAASQLSWADIDAVAGGVPVYVPRADLHSALGSSALLSWAGLNDNHDGSPLRGDRHVAVRRAMHDVSDATRDQLYRMVLDYSAKRGVVELHENSAPGIDTREGLARLINMTQDPVSGFPRIVGYRGELVSTLEEAHAISEAIPGLAGLAGDLSVDGSFGSRSAWLREEYADAPGNKGSLYLSTEQVAAHVTATSLAGLQGGFHVIGDAALDVVLTGYHNAAAQSDDIRRAIRRTGHRLEHVELVDDDALTVFTDLGIAVSAQPAFDAWWGGQQGMYATRLGQRRAQRTTPLRTLMSAGIPVAFGSDSPVTPISPWDGVRAAIWHHNTEERVSARAAFRAHSRGGHRVAGDMATGEIRVGAPAHLVLWEADELGVQAENDGRSAWSTDARSGTPLLPYLAEQGESPRALITWRAGHIIHNAMNI